MEIAILADPKRKKKDQPVIDEAEEAFDEAIYAPITQVRFELTKSPTGPTVRFNGTDLKEAECILPIPTIAYSELFYTALWMLDRCMMPIDAEKYLLLMNDEVLFNFLRSNGVPVRRSLTVASNVSLRSIEKSISYPVVVKPPKKRVVVTNKRTLKDVISLYKRGTPIRIEAPIKAEKDVWVFALGNEVLASYEMVRGASKPVAIDGELKRSALTVRGLIGCEYCSMRFLMQKNEWIIDRVTLSPDFPKIQKVTGINAARYIVSSLAEKVKEKPWYKRFEELFKFKV